MACSGYQPDNTFFVESDESNQHMSMRDAAKMLARNKQEMIANELSRLACDEYLEDIMQHMRHMEVNKNSWALDWFGDAGRD
jgi:glutamyl-tRNA reductase